MSMLSGQDIYLFIIEVQAVIGEINVARSQIARITRNMLPKGHYCQARRMYQSLIVVVVVVV